ncbi:precorrin-2 C20-methyltransferase [Candidatus Magnetobacterium bavaricum]|uniref:Precorrin-2 C20-methyltransferase n=1 Tax=Candidatus Magnetobacterium bavaricum TaxID=29290 RepID=A0A0F3GLN9_9BACT|nr:precorrin-2 C20-methyltransferase [Candidatus Magnetobacterium bavaricum]
MRDHSLYLKDIIESIGLIEQFVDGMELEDFKKVGKRLDTLVEAVRQAAHETDILAAFLVQRVGLADETIYDLLSVTPPAEAGYLSIAIIRSRT